MPNNDPLLTSIDRTLKELLKLNTAGATGGGASGYAAQTGLFGSLQASVGQRHGAVLGGVLGGGIGPGASLGEAIGGGIGKLGGSVAAMVAPVNAATAAVGSFVKVSNPALMEKFNTVLEDITGVIGQALAPVIEALLPAVRLFGDFLASVLPDASDFKSALEPLGGFLDELRDALKSVAPIVKDVLIFGLKMLGEALRLVLIPIRYVIGVLKGLFGSDEAEKLKSSTGAAARNIRFEDPMSAVKNVYAAAYKAVGTGPGGKPEKTPLDKIQDSIDSAVNWLQKIFGADSVIRQAINWLVKIVQDIFKAIPQIWKEGKQFFQDVGKLGVGGTIDAIFGKGKDYTGPKDVVHQMDLEKQGKQFGKVKAAAGAIGMIPFETTRNAVGESVLKEMLDTLKAIYAKAGNARLYEGDVNELLDWAGMTSQRGIEGTSSRGR